MNEALDALMVEWFERRLAGEDLDRDEIARSRGVDPAAFRALVDGAELLVARHAAARAETRAGEMAPGTRLLDYEIREEIGRGAMGIVYRGIQHPLARDVAIKVLAPHLARDARRRERFVREARAAAALDHPGIVRVLAAGDDAGDAFLVMEWVSGPTLAARLNDGPLAPIAAARLCAKIARALHHAHERGMVHRDVKPANVLVDAAFEPHVVDFGLAKRLGEETLTATGDQLGSPAYASPEQLSGSATVGPRSDVWSLGVVLYECLTGERPFGGTSVESVIHAVLHDDPPPARRGHPQVPAELEAVCSKALEKAPGGRYASAAAFAADLEAFTRGEAVSARPASCATRAWRALRKRPRALLAATALPVGALTVALVWLARLEVRASERKRLDSELLALQFAGDEPAYARALEEACRRHPEHSEYRLLRCIVALERGDLGSAREEALAALPGTSASDEVLDLVADLDRMLAGAPPASPSTAAHSVTDPRILVARGHLLSQVGSWDEAARLFEEASYREPRYAALLAWRYSFALLCCGQGERAYATLAPLASAKGPPVMHQRLIEVACLMKDSQRAQADLARMRELHPDSAFTVAAELSVAMPGVLAWNDHPKPDTAPVHELLARAEKAPDWPSARARVTDQAIEFLTRAQEFAVAVEMQEREIARGRSEPGDHMRLASNLVQLGQRDRALAEFETAARLAEKSPIMRDFARGMCAYTARDWPRAAEHFRRAVAVAPRRVEYWQNLALSTEFASRQPGPLAERHTALLESIGAWGKATELDPGTELYWRRLVGCTTELVAVEEALGSPDAAPRAEQLERLIRKRDKEFPDAEAALKAARTRIKNLAVDLRRQERRRGTDSAASRR